MKIFISWSGNRSHEVAKLLSEWLKCVLQACKPWISSDMDRGVFWFNAVNEALTDTSTGIVCLTAENLNAPWILFETGSLSNGISDKRVCTFLIDVNPTDVEPPLSQFNHTKPNKIDMLNLVKTINGRLGDKQLEKDTLTTVFDTYYPQFEKQFNEIISRTENVKGKAAKNTSIRSEQAMLEEILISVRNLNQRVGRIENLSSAKNQQQLAEPYKIVDIRKEILLKWEPQLIRIVKGEDTGEDLFTLEKKVSKIYNLPPWQAEDILLDCIEIKKREYMENISSEMHDYNV